MVLVMASGAALWRWHPLWVNRIQTSVLSSEVPVVMRTEGGLLEVAVIRAQERFSRIDAREFWGIPLGTTVSHIQAPAFYRYHIELARQWPLVIRGKTCIVRAPALQPSLPVAFDTSAMQTFTQNGWARFNSRDNLEALQKAMSAELELRARSEAYRQLVTEPARQTVKEFVARWLVKEGSWGTGSGYEVQVLFPGETALPASPPRQD
jgi:hypothetical protein